MSFSFPVESRLINSSDYSYVFSRPNMRVARDGLILLAKKSQREKPRVGIVVAKKDIKTATKRNQYKRLTREFFRLNQGKLMNNDYVVIVKKKCAELNNAQYSQLLSKLYKKFEVPSSVVSES